MAGQALLVQAMMTQHNLALRKHAKQRAEVIEEFKLSVELS